MGTFMLIAPGSLPDAYNDVPPSRARGFDERTELGRARGRVADLDDRERHHVGAGAQEPRHLLARLVLATDRVTGVAEAVGTQRDDGVEIAGREHPGRGRPQRSPASMPTFSGCSRTGRRAPTRDPR